jgi:alpha-1,3-glucan synthase
MWTARTKTRMKKSPRPPSKSLDGIFEAVGDPLVNFVELWDGLLAINDMVNANTGKFDPRHLYGASNHDVFRC